MSKARTLANFGGTDLATQAELDAKEEYNDDVIQTNLALLGFKVAVNGSLAKYDLQDQIIDEYTDASGVNTGDSTYEELTGGVYRGASAGSTATGGTIIEEVAYTGGGYRSHTFFLAGNGSSTNIFTPASSFNVNYLIVAGGGGGGSNAAAGGGAGGFLTDATYAVSAQAYTITVGAGGAGSVGSGNGVKGDNSVITPVSSGSAITATGGGYGGGGGGGTSGGAGGSSGGRQSGGNGANANAPSPSGQGNAGGGSPAAGGNYPAGGGGGASAVGGTPANNTAAAGDGGAGTANYYRDGNESGTTAGIHIFAGGGGGGGNAGTAGTGGSGGGGAGTVIASTNATDGTANTGGGGGGTRNANGGAGGSGIVVIRYIPETIEDLILQSSDTTAEAAPTKADMVILVEDAGTGVGTLDTTTGHIKGWVSRYETGDVKTWTQVPLVDEGHWEGGPTGGKRILAAHDVTLTGTSGTQMAYKITTHSASAVYDTKIHATSIGWR